MVWVEPNIVSISGCNDVTNADHKEAAVTTANKIGERAIAHGVLAIAMIMMMVMIMMIMMIAMMVMFAMKLTQWLSASLPELTSIPCIRLSASLLLTALMRTVWPTLKPADAVLALVPVAFGGIFLRGFTVNL